MNPRSRTSTMMKYSSKSQVEAVIIAIADQFHVEAARKALAAGKHVLVEKPLGVSVEECEQVRTSA